MNLHNHRLAVDRATHNNDMMLTTPRYHRHQPGFSGVTQAQWQPYAKTHSNSPAKTPEVFNDPHAQTRSGNLGDASLTNFFKRWPRPKEANAPTTKNVMASPRAADVMPRTSMKPQELFSPPQRSHRLLQKTTASLENRNEFPGLAMGYSMGYPRAYRIASCCVRLGAPGLGPLSEFPQNMRSIMGFFP